MRGTDFILLFLRREVVQWITGASCYLPQVTITSTIWARVGNSKTHPSRAKWGLLFLPANSSWQPEFLLSISALVFHTPHEPFLAHLSNKGNFKHLTYMCTDTHWSHIRVERRGIPGPLGLLEIFAGIVFFFTLFFLLFFSLHHSSIMFREAYLACWHRAVYSNSVNRTDHGLEMSQDCGMNQILSRESWLVCCRQWTQWLQEEKKKLIPG